MVLIKGDFTAMQYTKAYVDKINNNEIVVGRKIIQALNRVQSYLDKYEFIGNKAYSKINFIESETCQTKGSNANLKLALPQKVWLEIVWGFYKKSESNDKLVRVIHQVPIMMGRGNGKTTLISAVALVGLLIDDEYGADVQILATTRQQAELAFSASKAMLNKAGSLLNKLTLNKQLKRTKQGLMFEPTNSLMSVKTSKYETLDGTNAHYNVFDEVHAYKTDFIKVVNDGSTRKRSNWISWYVTTNGRTRDAVFDRYYKTWADVLSGKIDDDSIFPFLYEIDSLEDVSDIKKHPEKAVNFQKANPMIGYMDSLSTSSIMKDLLSAESDIIAQQEILAKTFNYPMLSYGTFFNNMQVLGNSDLYEDVFKGTEERYKNVILGVDLASVNDIASVALLTKKDDVLYYKTFSFLPKESMYKMPYDKQQFLEQQVDKGNLIVHDLPENDIKLIFDHVADYLDSNYLRPVVLAPDPWSIDTFEVLYNDRYGYKVHYIRQGARTLSKPMQSYRSLIDAGKIVWNNALVNWAHANVVADVDSNNGVKPNKRKSVDKIDPFAAQLDAYVGYYELKEDYLKEWLDF